MSILISKILKIQAVVWGRSAKAFGDVLVCRLWRIKGWMPSLLDDDVDIRILREPPHVLRMSALNLGLSPTLMSVPKDFVHHCGGVTFEGGPMRVQCATRNSIGEYDVDELVSLCRCHTFAEAVQSNLSRLDSVEQGAVLDEPNINVSKPQHTPIPSSPLLLFTPIGHPSSPEREQPEARNSSRN
jgi:hypothetical protein